MSFSISAGSYHWINGEADEPGDYCLHGLATAVIGDERFEYDCTVSAAALYLLKTLSEDHIMGEDNQLLPCCGFFLCPDERGENVAIVGCGNGADWSVLHEGGSVRLITASGRETSVPLSDYAREVCNFADEVAAYYAACSPKPEPGDEFLQARVGAPQGRGPAADLTAACDEFSQQQVLRLRFRSFMLR